MGVTPPLGGGAALRKKRAWAGRLPPCYQQPAKTTGETRLGNGCMQRLTPRSYGRKVSGASVWPDTPTSHSRTKRVQASSIQARPRVPSCPRAPARGFSSPTIQPQLSHLLRTRPGQLWPFGRAARITLPIAARLLDWHISLVAPSLGLRLLQPSFWLPSLSRSVTAPSREVLGDSCCTAVTAHPPEGEARAGNGMLH